MLQSYGLSLSVIIGKGWSGKIDRWNDEIKVWTWRAVVCRIKEFEPPLVIRHNVLYSVFIVTCHFCDL